MLVRTRVGVGNSQHHASLTKGLNKNWSGGHRKRRRIWKLDIRTSTAAGILELQWHTCSTLRAAPATLLRLVRCHFMEADGGSRHQSCLPCVPLSARPPARRRARARYVHMRSPSVPQITDQTHRQLQGAQETRGAPARSHRSLLVFWLRPRPHLAKAGHPRRRSQHQHHQQRRHAKAELAMRNADDQRHDDCDSGPCPPALQRVKRIMNYSSTCSTNLGHSSRHLYLSDTPLDNRTNTSPSNGKWPHIPPFHHVTPDSPRSAVLCFAALLHP